MKVSFRSEDRDGKQVEIVEYADYNGKDTIVRPATDSDRETYKAEYDAYLQESGNQAQQDGQQQQKSQEGESVQRQVGGQDNPPEEGDQQLQMGGTSDTNPVQSEEPKQDGGQEAPEDENGAQITNDNPDQA